MIFGSYFPTYANYNTTVADGSCVFTILKKNEQKVILLLFQKPLTCKGQYNNKIVRQWDNFSIK